MVRAVICHRLREQSEGLMSNNEEDYKRVTIDHTLPVNTSAVLVAAGFNIARHIETSKELFGNGTVYSQHKDNLL